MRTVGGRDISMPHWRLLVPSSSGHHLFSANLVPDWARDLACFSFDWPCSSCVETESSLPFLAEGTGELCLGLHRAGAKVC